MSDSISRETREQLEALCRKISVSRKVDGEIRRELYGHMEDRLLAHMNGDIPLTEQDAFILVREHFGDPAMIKERIQEVHAEESASVLGRRLVAAYAACTAVNVVSSVLQLCLAAVPAFLGSWREPFQMGLFGAIELVFIPGMLYVVLRAWRRRMERGEFVWFHTASTKRILTVLGVTTILAVGSVPFFYWVQSKVPNTLGGDLDALTTLGVLTSVLIMGATWIWFCDQPPRTRRNVCLAALGWALSLALVSFTAACVHGMSLRLVLINVFGSLSTTGVFAALSLGLYWLAARVGRTHSLPVQSE